MPGIAVECHRPGIDTECKSEYGVGIYRHLDACAGCHRLCVLYKMSVQIWRVCARIAGQTGSIFSIQNARPLYIARRCGCACRRAGNAHVSPVLALAAQDVVCFVLGVAGRRRHRDQVVCVPTLRKSILYVVTQAAEIKRKRAPVKFRGVGRCQTGQCWPVPKAASALRVIAVWRRWAVNGRLARREQSITVCFQMRFISLDMSSGRMVFERGRRARYDQIGSEYCF